MSKCSRENCRQAPTRHLVIDVAGAHVEENENAQVDEDRLHANFCEEHARAALAGSPVIAVSKPGECYSDYCPLDI